MRAINDLHNLISFEFIEVWRQKEVALQNTQLTHLLLSNASHEGMSFFLNTKVIPLTNEIVRTPLNHIIK